MEYSRNFGSSFPENLLLLENKMDVDDTVVDLIRQYYTYIDSGNISSANAFYMANKSILRPYVINMELINRYEEEIYNIGLFALKKSTNIISDTEPLDQDVNGCWYQDY